ncbi:hypothetical protein E1B28_011768 [Marasmius oreades]|uniref:Major facilitator superfamily (MFS) profile domain-containing protein n=1 Tax=Marasmius oreades TaxID=181124 RepID=A0A9P7RVH4_9AGAR|nr:uncharacterized protein E1B28_011768 [Marasmius oreades]KAG7090160.1 hypothetical protein E1B28_011768 [Marasmius oreades]
MTVAKHENGRPRTTPLPKLQTALALLISHAEPVTATVIYPFIPAFVRRTGITNGDEKKTGHYAGIIESLFFISECLCVFHWGRASDRLGRRPILLIGPLGLAIATFGFGLSTSFWQLVVFRCIQGVFNGNIGVVKTLLAEITDDTNLPDALTLLQLMWNVGVTIGPAMGGLLTDPAKRWPRIFGNEFFREYPYFLACAGPAFLAFATFVICFFFLNETLRDYSDKEHKTDPSECDPLLPRPREIARTHHHDPVLPVLPPPNEPSPTLHEIIIPNVPLQRSLTCHAFYSFTNMSYTVLVPLIYSTSIPNGGLGLSPYKIGAILGVEGVCVAVFPVFGWKPMLNRIGLKNTFILSYSFHIVRIGMLMLARMAVATTGTVDWMVWMLIAAQISSSMFSSVAYNTTATLILKSTPPNALGAVNGIQQMISSGLKGLAPTVASSLFAVSLALDWKVTGGEGGICRYMADLIQLVVITAGVWYSLKLPNYKLIQ